MYTELFRLTAHAIFPTVMQAHTLDEVGILGTALLMLNCGTAFNR